MLINPLEDDEPQRSGIGKVAKVAKIANIFSITPLATLPTVTKELIRMINCPSDSAQICGTTSCN
jgi:hypothetical protein